jgi:hypothetical protein
VLARANEPQFDFLHTRAHANARNAGPVGNISDPGGAAIVAAQVLNSAERVSERIVGVCIYFLFSLTARNAVTWSQLIVSATGERLAFPTTRSAS